MTATKTLAGFPTLAAKLAEVLSEPPEFGARQPYGGDFEVCDAQVGHANIDVGCRAGTTDVTFVAITGEANSKGGRDEVCGDAVAVVAACCGVDVQAVPRDCTAEALARMMAAEDVTTAWTVLDGVRIDVVGGHDRLDLSCEPA